MTTFFFVMLILSVIAMAIDASDKIQSFLKEDCSLGAIFFDYYLGFVLDMVGKLTPLYTLIAVIFFTSRLASQSEILSILNAGISFPRLLRPYILAALMIAAMHLVFAHFIIPNANKKRLKFERTYVWTDKQQVRGSKVHLQVAPGVKVYVHSYDKTSQLARDMRIVQLRGQEVLSMTEARSARWQEEKGKWALEDYTVRTFDGQKETYKFVPSTPLDTLLDLTPGDFIFYHNENEEMTTPELQSVIARDKFRGQGNTKSFEIETHRRTAEPFTNVILAIIGLAVAGRKVRGGVGLHLAIGIGIGAAFIILSRFAVSFAGNPGMPILLGIWLPNLVFAVVAAILVMRSQQ